jgi:hypothetical protein
MDPESKKLLEETFSLAEDNNKMLHKIRSMQKWASFMRVMYWLIIIGVSVGSFYFLQPYVNEVKNMIEVTGSTFDQFKNIIPNSR